MADPHRVEDHRLLTGSGAFIADLALPGALHAVILRSPHAHARINSIDTDAARAAPGVHAVLTASELAADGIGGIPWEVAPPSDGSPPVEGDPAAAAPQDLLAGSRVRYVGEPVALIIADSQHQAQDAAERVVVDYTVLPAVTRPHASLQPDAPLLHGTVQDGGNACFHYGLGDAAATDAAFARAHCVARLHAVNQRLVAAPIETRGYAGVWDMAKQSWTLHAAAGKPHPIRRTLARFVFGVPEAAIRVLVGDVGGGFGAKNVLYAEAALVLWAARRLNRPVRWQASRTDSFQSDMQGRDHTSTAAMAFDAAGGIMAIRIATLADLGAWLGPRAFNTVVTGAIILSGAYRIPTGRLDVTGVFTNTVPTCPYRGAGAPEMIFLIERLVDLGAQQLGLAADEIRRRNVIAPDAMPYPTIGGVVYESCDFPRVLEQALTCADWHGFTARRAAASSAGRRRGIGLSLSIEAYGTSFDECASLRLYPDGHVELCIGTQSSGQGHATSYALLIAGQLGVAMDSVRVVQGDTERIATGNGTGACRSLTTGGSACLRAGEALIEAGLGHAADWLETAQPDIAFSNGQYRVIGTDRAVAMRALAASNGGWAAAGAFRPSGYNFPYGCHVAEVEIDPETGQVSLARYTAVQDCGRPVSRRIVAGQMHGGIAQGVGQALLEHCAYDPADGQLLSASFMDYAMPRGGDLPDLAVSLHVLPTPSNLIGAKAVGEAGPTAAPPAIINAITDALGVAHIEMPATPERVWRSLQRGI